MIEIDFWFAVDLSGKGCLYKNKPKRSSGRSWINSHNIFCIQGEISNDIWPNTKQIWNDEPIKVAWKYK